MYFVIKYINNIDINIGSPLLVAVSKNNSAFVKLLIDYNFNIIYKYLSMGHDFKSVNYDLANIERHPSDLGGNQKWNIKTRYLIYNIKIE